MATKRELEKTIEELESKVAKLSQLVAEPGEATHWGIRYVARQKPQDGNLRSWLHGIACDIVSNSDDYSTEPTWRVCFSNDSIAPGVDGLFILAEYDNHAGFTVCDWFPAIAVK